MATKKRSAVPKADVQKAIDRLPPSAAKYLRTQARAAIAQGVPRDRAGQLAYESMLEHWAWNGSRWLRRKPRRPNPTEGRLLKRPPIGSIDGHACAELGSLLEVATETLVFRFNKGKIALCWFPRLNALVALDGAKRGRKFKPDEVEAKAASVYERWADRDVRNERTDVIKFGRGARWVTFGRCKRVDYASDKWTGKTIEYTHDTGKSVKFYRFGGSAPPYLWVIKGRSLRVTARGLVG